VCEVGDGSQSPYCYLAQLRVGRPVWGFVRDTDTYTLQVADILKRFGLRGDRYGWSKGRRAIITSSPERCCLPTQANFSLDLYKYTLI
jgi:hypothetical protein